MKITLSSISSKSSVGWFCKTAMIIILATSASLVWFMTGFPSAATAIDETATPTPKYEEPEFPEYNPQPEDESRPALYAVPLALSPHDHFYFTRPIAVDTNSSPSPDFRYGFYYPDDDTAHSGVDIVSPLHKPVLAAGDGEVIFAGYGLMYGAGNTEDPYGLAVMIKHNFSYQDKTVYTVYAHLDEIDVEDGQIIKAGDPIGIIGMTGNTSGPHLHFEVRVDDPQGGRVQNPELWLVPPIGSGVLAGTLKNDYGYLLSTQELTLKSLESGRTYDLLTYAPLKSIHPDDYFQENLVIGDIPAGEYQISMLYRNKWYRMNITIAPGTVNFVTFNGKNGFSSAAPTTPDPLDFLH